MAILDTLQLTSQVEKLAQVSRDLRRKHKQLQNQVKYFICIMIKPSQGVKPSLWIDQDLHKFVGQTLTVSFKLKKFIDTTCAGQRGERGLQNINLQGRGRGLGYPYVFNIIVWGNLALFRATFKRAAFSAF